MNTGILFSQRGLWQPGFHFSITSAMVSIELISSLHHHYHYHYICYLNHIHVCCFLHLRQQYTIPSKQKPRWDSTPFLSSSDNNTAIQSYASVLQACTNIKSLKQLHAHMLINGLEQNIILCTKLVNRYAMYGSLHSAHLVFDKTYDRNVFIWNAIIRGYAGNGPFDQVLTLYFQMEQEGIRPDNFTFPFVVKACASLSDLQKGKKIHTHVIRTGFETDVFVGAALIHMYAKCGNIVNARQVFDKMSRRDLVSWNSMIAGYAQTGHANEAMTLFHQMQLTDMTPDGVTMAIVLLACSHIGALKQGKWIHEYIKRQGFEINVFMGSALIDMYAKCGSIENARNVFDNMSKRDVVSWSAMIAGYGVHGHGEDAIALFSQMQQTGMKPDHITFVCVLSACSHAGLVDKGWQYFYCMRRDYGITPRVEHYTCMVDLLGRAGQLDEALDFIKRMPFEPDAAVWAALLSACRIHCNIELGERVAEHLFNLGTRDTGHYVLLSNIYAAAGRWGDVVKVRTMMKDKGLKKIPGYSLIEVNDRVHTFIVGDRSHPQSEKIYATLEILAGQMEKVGYVPDTNLVLHDVEEEVKEHILYSHSEKLAIAFGLISTSPGTPIRITKNLRVCGDCHSATKFISKLARREIILPGILMERSSPVSRVKFHPCSSLICVFSSDHMFPFLIKTVFAVLPPKDISFKDKIVGNWPVPSFSDKDIMKIIHDCRLYLSSLKSPAVEPNKAKGMLPSISSPASAFVVLALIYNESDMQDEWIEFNSRTLIRWFHNLWQNDYRSIYLRIGHIEFGLVNSREAEFSSLKDVAGLISISFWSGRKLMDLDSLFGRVLQVTQIGHLTQNCKKLLLAQQAKPSKSQPFLATGKLAVNPSQFTNKTNNEEWIVVSWKITTSKSQGAPPQTTKAPTLPSLGCRFEILSPQNTLDNVQTSPQSI
eukprot:Gb_17095 [translate_table: standard]